MLSRTDDIIDALREFADAKRAAHSPKFFKAIPGGYGEGDEFLGVAVPDSRKVAMRFSSLIEEPILSELVKNRYHEARLTALFILVRWFEDALRHKDFGKTGHLFEFYLDHLDYVNNWDLVDSTAYKIAGRWLFDKNRAPLYELSNSGHLWRERVSVVATLEFIRQGDTVDTIQLARFFLNHPHDLMHKAVGWMLREAGKKNPGVLHEFLRAHSRQMPRTMLRYSIEKLSPEKRSLYLAR